MRASSRRLRVGLSSLCWIGFLLVLAGCSSMPSEIKPSKSALAQGLDNAIASSLSGTMNNLRDAHSKCRTASRKKAPEACAVNDLLEEIANFLVKYNFSDPANSFKEAIEMVARFIFNFASQGLKPSMKFLIQEFGPLAPFVYTQLKNVDPELIESWVAPYLWSAQPCAEEREKAEERGEFPPIIQDPLSCLLWMIGRFSAKGVKGMDQLMGYLAALAAMA